MAALESSHTNCEECNINNCKCLQRILNILTQYQQWLYSDHVESISSLINDSYSMQHIFRDYKHIKEINYNIDSCPQSLSKCIPNDRHRRDNYNNYKQLYFTKEIKEILIQKLLDQIHLFLYHPLSNNQSDKSSNHRFITNKQNVIEVATETKEKNGDHEEVEEKKYTEPINMDIEVIEKDAYNFGQQFFYWDYYKTHPWFITKKYENLQEELLNNELCTMEKIVWDMEYENAMDKFEYDERLKALRSIGEFEDRYLIADGETIDVNHLLPLLFYCNTDELQRVFSSTYRRNGNESDDIFRHRHRNFYHFGRLLRETVECYGDVLVDDGLVLYHGIDHPLYFEKMIAKFYSPTSTTKDMAIAAQFAGKETQCCEIFCKIFCSVPISFVRTQKRFSDALLVFAQNIQETKE